MRTLANLIWLLLAGLWLAAGYVVAGIIACLFIVTIPVGIASFRMANLVLWPFGRTAVPSPSAGAMSGLANLVWFVVAGWWLALLHLVTAVGQAVTIVGIPNAVVALKLIPISCFPFGKMIVDKA